MVTTDTYHWEIFVDFHKICLFMLTGYTLYSLTHRKKRMQLVKRQIYDRNQMLHLFYCDY